MDASESPPLPSSDAWSPLAELNAKMKTEPGVDEKECWDSKLKATYQTSRCTISKDLFISPKGTVGIPRKQGPPWSEIQHVLFVQHADRCLGPPGEGVPHVVHHWPLQGPNFDYMYCLIPVTLKVVIIVYCLLFIGYHAFGQLVYFQVIFFRSHEYPVAFLSAAVERSTECPVFFGQAQLGHKSTTLTMTLPFRPLIFRHFPQAEDFPPRVPAARQSRSLRAA